MKHAGAVIFAIAAMMAFMVGCTNSPVKDDIVNYSKTAIPLYNKYSMDINTRLNKAQNLKKREDYISITTKEILPLFQEYKEKMATVKPATKELQDIHNTYIGVIVASEEGLAILLKALTTGDKELAKVASDKISTASQGEDTYRKSFNDLAKKNHVKVE